MAKSKDLTMCRLTAMQIESGENLPPRLQEIGKQIEVKLAKAAMHQGKAIDMFDSIGRLLDEAKEFCDGSGFDAFKRTFCPSLGKSRAYEMLAIASGKKALEDVRAETRARVAKHRANKTGASHSVTVTEKSGPEAEGALSEVAPADGGGIVPEQTPEAAKPVAIAKAPPAVRNIALNEFTGHVRRLLQMTNRNPRHFVDSGVKADDLHKLSVFLSSVAQLKSELSQQSPEEISPEESGERMKAKHAAREADGDQGA